MFDHLPRAAAMIYSGEHTRIGSGVNYPINRGKVLEVRGVSNIAVLDGDFSRAQDRTIDLASGPDEVIDPAKFERRPVLTKPDCKRTTDEAADTCNEEFHR